MHDVAKLSEGKGPPVHSGEEAGGFQSSSGNGGEENKSDQIHVPFSNVGRVTQYTSRSTYSLFRGRFVCPYSCKLEYLV
jgi:hypothetical protein